MHLAIFPATITRAVSFHGLRRIVLSALAAGLFSAQAQAQDSTLTRLVRKYQYDLIQSNGQFSGAGWDKLQPDIQKSQLVLLGEDHGMAQIPGFAAAVARVQKPTLYVTEIDKYQAQDLGRLAAQPGLPVSFEKQHPMGLAFYSWAEEFELARTLRAQGVAIRGIEQVGIGSPGRFMEVLAEKVKSKSAKAYLQQRAVAYQARDRAAMVTDKPASYTMFALGQSGLDSLRLYTAKEGPEVQGMVKDFEASYQIYQASFAGKASSHYTRINLMKRNLLTELQPFQTAAQPLPKTLFKFGAYHVGQGRSMWGDIYDVGNLAKNLADIHDQQSLHIFVIGKQGTQAKPGNPEVLASTVAKFSNEDKAMVQPFVAQTKAGGAWQVFDVRPVRQALLRKKLTVSSPQLEATILGYDYVVIIPEATASHGY